MLIAPASILSLATDGTPLGLNIASIGTLHVFNAMDTYVNSAFSLQDDAVAKDLYVVT